MAAIAVSCTTLLRWCGWVMTLATSPGATLGKESTSTGTPCWSQRLAKVKADSEKGGVLTTKIESVFLAGTDYSPLK